MIGISSYEIAKKRVLALQIIGIYSQVALPDHSKYPPAGAESDLGAVLSCCRPSPGLRSAGYSEVSRGGHRRA
jgi:hypothetical protein